MGYSYSLRIESNHQKNQQSTRIMQVLRYNNIWKQCY